MAISPLSGWSRAALIGALCSAHDAGERHRAAARQPTAPWRRRHHLLMARGARRRMWDCVAELTWRR